MQNLHQSLWNYAILYAGRFSEDVQLLIISLLINEKKEYIALINVNIQILSYGKKLMNLRK